MTSPIEWLKNQTIRVSGPPSRTGTMHHYICCGKMHCKIGVMIIILFRFALILALLAMIMYHDYWYSQVLDVFFDIVEVLAFILLVYAFFKEDSRFMWPYMAIEFTSLVFTLIAYSMAATTVMFPNGPYSKIIPKVHKEDNTDLTLWEKRIEALKWALIMMLMGAYVIWELSVLLACNRYFDDIKHRKQEVQQRAPIIINQSDQIASTHINMEPDTVLTSQQQKNAAYEQLNQKNGDGPAKSFANPNFSLSDSEDEDLWPQRKPNGHAKNPALS